MLVGARCERDECQEPKRSREHEPAGGPAELHAGIYRPDYGRAAENRRDQAPGHRFCRGPLAGNEKVGNVLHMARAADGDDYKDDEVENESQFHCQYSNRNTCRL